MRRRTILSLCWLTVFTSICVWVLTRVAGYSSALDTLNLVSAVTGTVGLVIGVFQMIAAASVADPGQIDEKAQLARGCSVLADQVAEQWRREARTRSLYQPSPIQVRWSVPKQDIAGPPENLLAHTVGGRPVRLKLHGRLGENVEKYLQLPRRQLVVLGDPGSGKTVFALLLTLGLIERRTETDAVPVLLPVSTWNPTSESLYDWIERRVGEDYPGLRILPSNIGDMPRQLVNAQRILPVLDGLDEIPVALRGPALAEIGHSTRHRAIVVTCRTQEYAEAVKAGGVLASAAVIELSPVTPRDAISFLSADPALDGTKWSAVSEVMRSDPDHPIRAALATPLMISLARAVYRSDRDDPAELLDDTTFPTQDDIERHLLALYIPTVYLNSPTAASKPHAPVRPQWTARQIQDWLAFLARHLESLQTPDFAWWQLHRSLNRRAAVTTFVLFVWLTAMVMSALVFGPLTGSPLISPVGIAVGCACGLTAAVTARFGSLPGLPVRLQLVSSRRTDRREMVRSAIVGGLAPGLVVTAAFTIATNVLTGVLSGVLTFAAIGLAAGILRWSTPAERATAVDPRSVLRTDRVATLFWASVVSVVVTGFVYSILARTHPHLAAFLAAITTGGFLGFGYMLGAAWSWLQVTRFWLALRRRLPWRLMAFLDDAHERGVLRLAGAVYQFRHRRLQDYLTTTGESTTTRTAAQTLTGGTASGSASHQAAT